MASLRAFAELLQTEPERAMTEYVVENHTESLDGDVRNLQACTERDLVLDFAKPNKVVVRAKGPTQTADQRPWYLPWVYNSLPKGESSGDGPGFFSTSQLSGYRFTIQYHDASRSRVTVMRLAGRLGTGTKQGTEARDRLESAELEELGSAIGPVDATPRRRYWSRLQKARRIADRSTLYYGGNMAWMFGSRDSDGGWSFVAQEVDEHEGTFKGMGLKRFM